MTAWKIGDAPYKQWIEHVETPWRHKLRSPDVKLIGNSSWPLISIIIPTYNTPPEFLQQALDSVLNQNYPKWELCIADDASTDSSVGEVIRAYLERNSRIQATFRPLNGGIAAATNSALNLTKGQYVAFMDHDDVLPPHALSIVAQEIRSHGNIQLLYSDSDNLNSSGERCNPFFKPDWNYDLFLAQNYVNHLCVYNRNLLKKLRGLREGFDGSQDYDLALRATELINPEQIKHLSHILYHWRVLPSSVSQSNLGQAIKAARKAVAEHLTRTGQPAVVSAPKNAVIFNRIDWQPPEPREQMLIFVHGRDEKLIAESVAAIKAITNDKNFRIKELVTRKSTDCRPLGTVLNMELMQERSDLICIVPAGFCPESKDWIQRIAGQLNRREVGAVGAKVLSSNSRLVGGPVVSGLKSSSNGIGLARTFENASESDKGYFARLALDHQVSALHGACLATRRQQFNHVNGFNPDLSSLALLGADFSFRLHEKALTTIWSAQILARCSETVSHEIFQTPPCRKELAHFQKLWSHKLQRDPFYNSNFSSSGIGYQLPV